MTTFIPKADGLERKWFVIDAKGQVLGKLADKYVGPYVWELAQWK